MMRKKLCLFGVLALLIFTVTVSCDKYPITITPVLIEEGIGGFGNSSGKEEIFVIKTEEEWDNLMCFRSQFCDDSCVTACRRDLAEKNINFDMSQVIAVIDEVRPSTGWRINIVSIKEYSDDIVVNIYIKVPKGTELDMLTQPYQIVKIPVTSKDVVFKYVNFIPSLDLEKGML